MDNEDVFYYTVAPVHHWNGSPDTWVIKRVNTFNPHEPRYFGKNCKFGHKQVNSFVQEFNTKAEAEFILQSRPHINHLVR